MRGRRRLRASWTRAHTSAFAIGGRGSRCGGAARTVAAAAQEPVNHGDASSRSEAGDVARRDPVHRSSDPPATRGTTSDGRAQRRRSAVLGPSGAGTQEPQQRRDLGAERRTDARSGPRTRARTGTRRAGIPAGAPAAMVPAFTRAPAKPMRAFGSARLTSPSTAIGREDAPGGRVRHQAEMYGSPAARSALERRNGLGELHERQRALLHPGAARGGDDEQRHALGDRASSAARATFSPTTAPIEPPMNAKSMTHMATARRPPPCRHPRRRRRACPSPAGRRRIGPDTASGPRTPAASTRLEAGVALARTCPGSTSRSIRDRARRAGNGDRTTGTPDRPCRAAC